MSFIVALFTESDISTELMSGPKSREWVHHSSTTGAPKLINSDLFLEKRATVPIKTQVVQRSSSGKMSMF